MKLLEHEAKKLLRASDITTPAGVLVRDNSQHIAVPIVLKAQVLSGRRNNYGGVKIVKDSTEIADTVDELLSLTVDGEAVSLLLAEEFVDIRRELYLSLMIDYETSSIQLLAHKDGGVAIESQQKDTFYTQTLTKETITVTGQQLAEYYGLEAQEFLLTELMERLYECFVTNDVLLLEINPLVLDTKGELIAADCKITLDDASAFRHPDWDFHDKKKDSQFVTLNSEGNLATIANGAGLAMATVDAAALAGFEVTNFLDIGGGANEAKILACFEEIAAYPHVRAIVINIFAGITRCDEVARAILTAQAASHHLPDIYVRLEGTNKEIAAQLLEGAGLKLYPSLDDCLTAAKGSLT